MEDFKRLWRINCSDPNYEFQHKEISGKVISCCTQEFLLLAQWKKHQIFNINFLGPQKFPSWFSQEF